MTLIVEFAPTFGKAIIFDNKKMWLIEVDKPNNTITSVPDSKIHYVDQDPGFVRENNFRDQYPYHKIRTRLKHLYYCRIALIYLQTSISQENSISVRCTYAELLCGQEFAKKGVIEFVRKEFECYALDEVAEVNYRVLSIMPRVYAQIIIKAKADRDLLVELP